jgi:deazaflavin-dependent oxidoreductase (nitroreductase family)
MYVGPIGDLMASRCVMLLTTRGRRTGKPRTTPVSYMPLDNRFIVFAGWGVNSAWYRNLRAEPRVRIKVGRREMRGTARVVGDPARRAQLMRQMQMRSAHCGPPKPVRPLLKLSGLFDYEEEIRMAVAAGGTLPVVEIVPT